MLHKLCESLCNNYSIIVHYDCMDTVWITVTNVVWSEEMCEAYWCHIHLTLRSWSGSGSCDDYSCIILLMFINYSCQLLVLLVMHFPKFNQILCSFLVPSSIDITDEHIRLNHNLHTSKIIL
jgi:hypothetical protein